jgi:hypothetical protein
MYQPAMDKGRRRNSQDDGILKEGLRREKHIEIFRMANSL